MGKQIKATFGEREPSGSNYGGNYFRGDIHGDHGNLEYDKNMWPAAPTAEERAIIAEIADMSPSCSHINYWCAEQVSMHLSPGICSYYPRCVSSRQVILIYHFSSRMTQFLMKLVGQ